MNEHRMSSRGISLYLFPQGTVSVDVEERVHIRLLRILLVTAYHNTWAFAHSPVINNRVMDRLPRASWHAHERSRDVQMPMYGSWVARTRSPLRIHPTLGMIQMISRLTK